jgi:hypothetical protein
MKARIINLKMLTLELLDLMPGLSGDSEQAVLEQFNI